MGVAALDPSYVDDIENVKVEQIMVTPEAVQSYIASGLPCAHLAVEGDGQHFSAVIVSEKFAGLSRVRQHQLVYQVLGDRMREEIHALSLQTYTPEAWAENAGGRRG